MNEIKSFEEFENYIKLSKRIPVLIDFYAEWCMPCRFLAPILERVKEKLKGKIEIVKINVEEFPEISMEFSVMGVPTVVLLKNEEEVDRFVGAKSEQEIIEWLKENNVI